MIEFKFNRKQTKILELSAWTLAIVFLVATTIYYTFFDKTPTVETVKIGEICPEFTVATYKEIENVYESEQGYFSPSKHRGKVVVINFWATWCGPCVEEVPYFNALYEKYSSSVAMIAINGDPKEADIVGTFLTRKWSGYSIPFGQEVEGNVVLPLLSETTTLPVTIVLDEQGIVREQIYNAFKSSEEIESVILKYLND